VTRVLLWIYRSRLCQLTLEYTGIEAKAFVKAVSEASQYMLDSQKLVRGKRKGPFS
jgi:hypothetical protein